MIPEFKELNDEEVDLMLKSPLLAAILIAGADSTIDKTEMKEAVGVLTLSPQKARKELKGFYSLVAEDAEDKFKFLVNELPSDTSERNKLITEELRKLNTIFPKMDRAFRVRFYESLKDLAKRVAESSGGVFGFMSVGYEESKVMELKMIKDPSKG